MHADFVETLGARLANGETFCVATVVKVEGSASARTGSKAIFDAEGRNVYGWVGGGCAERYISEQALEALAERRTRTVWADLDDEIFGLGVACGGKMEVFIEPVFPQETVRLNLAPELRAEAEKLVRLFGWRLESSDQPVVRTRADLLLGLARAVADTRGREPRSLRLVKDLPVQFEELQISEIRELAILGKGRIAEAAAYFATAVGWSVTVFAPGLNPRDFPGPVRCECLRESYDEFQIAPGAAVLIASHHASDAEFVARAVAGGAIYVGMIGSRKRALDVLNFLSLVGGVCRAPLFVPAGLDLDARTPQEIGLSVISEILSLETRA